MKNFILIFCTCFVSIGLQAQLSDPAQSAEQELIVQEADVLLAMEESFGMNEANLDIPASHLDGAEGLANDIAPYLATNIPNGASLATVVITVFIDENGNPIRHLVKSGVSSKLDSRAITAVSSIQNWKPATKNGAATKSKLFVPVTFTQM